MRAKNMMSLMLDQVGLLGVSINLAPDCTIEKDPAVLSKYKHREIGLSRACLKKYNYNVHES
jgi:hypothetical protein